MVARQVVVSFVVGLMVALFALEADNALNGALEQSLGSALIESTNDLRSSPTHLPKHDVVANHRDLSFRAWEKHLPQRASNVSPWY